MFWNNDNNGDFEFNFVSDFLFMVIIYLRFTPRANTAPIPHILSEQQCILCHCSVKTVVLSWLWRLKEDSNRQTGRLCPPDEWAYYNLLSIK